MTYYHLNSIPLAPGSVIEPGNWGRIISLYGLRHNRFAVEAAMEDIRFREFSRKPSRLLSSFFFDSLEEARWYANADDSRAMMLLYEVELTDPNVAIHATDWRNNVPDSQPNLDWVRRYWNGTMLPPPGNGCVCRELLAIVPLRVVASVPRS